MCVHLALWTRLQFWVSCVWPIFPGMIELCYVIGYTCAPKHEICLIPILWWPLTSLSLLSGPVTDDNSESESDTEEKLKGKKPYNIEFNVDNYTGKDIIFFWLSFLIIYSSSQSEISVGPVYVEADRSISHFGARLDGAAGEEVVWVLPGCGSS